MLVLAGLGIVVSLAITGLVVNKFLFSQRGFANWLDEDQALAAVHDFRNPPTWRQDDLKVADRREVYRDIDTIKKRLKRS